MMKQSLLICLFILAANITSAQELNMRVTVNSDKIQGSNKQVYETLSQSITEYMNSTKWTSLTFADKERIECSMLIVVDAVEDGIYSCEMTIQSRRPVWGTSYSSPILNLKDKSFNFSYQEFDRMDFQQNSFTTNLAALLAYYAYLIIGYDMDTYSRLGGTPCFEMCEQIVSTCQGASITESEQQGWLAFDRVSSNKNRYALTSNLQDAAFKSLREYFYEYHRLGLDEMSGNVANGRARIAAGIEILKRANQARPATYIVPVFLDAKADELADIFHGGTQEEKQKVYETLTSIDVTRQTTYDRINEK